MSQNIEITKKWVEKTILGLNLCPFAIKPFEEGKILYAEELDYQFEKIYAKLLDSIKRIENSAYQTALLSLPHASESFQDFYSLSLEINEIFEQTHTPYQVVAFHPSFCFEKLEKSDRANFVNRSPLPCLHLLSQTDLEKAMQETDKAKNLSYINEKNIKNLSTKDLKEYFYYMRELQ